MSKELQGLTIMLTTHEGEQRYEEVPLDAGLMQMSVQESLNELFNDSDMHELTMTKVYTQNG